MASVNSDILIRTLLLEAVVVSFMFLAADFGDVTLAANQVLLQFLHVSAYALDGFAFAAEALVGQAMGARDRHALHRAALLTSVWGIGVAVAMAGLFALFGVPIIALMVTADAVRVAAASYLPWLIAAPLLGVAAFMLDGIFIGATRTRDMRNMMVLSVGLYALAVAVLAPGLHNHGLWLALLISYAARGITLWRKYPALERAAS